MKKLIILLAVYFFSGLFIQTGLAKTRTLHEDTRVSAASNNIILKRGTKAEFYSNGALKRGTLAAPLEYTYQGVKVPFCKEIYFYKNDMIRMGVLERPTKIPTREGTILARGNAGISFHDNGHVSMIVTKDYTMINKIRFERDSQVYFHKKNGKLHYSTLAFDTKVQGLTFKKGTQLYFHDNGKIAKGTLAVGKSIKKTFLSTKKLKAGKTYSFNRNGKVD